MEEITADKQNGGFGVRDLSTVRKISPRIDMTPVVDLAFLLLTFFMLATTFIKPQVMDLVLPKDAAKNEESRPLINEKNILNIVLRANNRIYWYIGVTAPRVQETGYASDGIRRVLLAHNRIEGMYILIKPDDASTYENLVDMLDELEITGTRRYALVPIETEDRTLVEQYACGGGVPTAPETPPEGDNLL